MVHHQAYVTDSVKCFIFIYLFIFILIFFIAKHHLLAQHTECRFLIARLLVSKELKNEKNKQQSETVVHF